MATFPLQRVLTGLGMAALVFVSFGTITALWNNPFFMRMEPVQGFEVPALAVLAALTGLYVMIRRAACSTTGATGAGVLGFFGVACPTCNKILLLLLGGEAALTYIEPIRGYIMLASIALMAWLTWREWVLSKQQESTA